MKQQAPKILPKKAETIENTRKTADILIGAACQKKSQPVGLALFLEQIWFESARRVRSQAFCGGIAAAARSAAKENAQRHRAAAGGGVLPYFSNQIRNGFQPPAALRPRAQDVSDGQCFLRVQKVLAVGA